MIARSAPDSVALSAAPAPVMQHRILRRVLMPMNAMGLARLFCHEASASQDVGSLGDCLKMGRVNAPFVATEVIEHSTRWDSAVLKLEGKNVRSLRSGLRSRNMKNAVVLRQASEPVPAAVSLLNLLPERFHGRLLAFPDWQVNRCG